MFKSISLRAESLAFLASLLLLAIYNFPLWHHVAAIVPADLGGLALRFTFGVMVLCIFNFVLVLLSFNWILKPVLIALLLISAGVTYFMSQYGVMVDVNMLRNVMETDPAEVHGLLTIKLVFFILVMGVLPSWLLWKLHIVHQPLKRAIRRKLLIAVGSLAVLGGTALTNYQGLASLFRNHHELRLLVVPSNYIYAAFGYAKEQFAAADVPMREIGIDAHEDQTWKSHQHKSLTVLVIGESARAENFSLFGYSRLNS